MTELERARAWNVALGFVAAAAVLMAWANTESPTMHWVLLIWIAFCIGGTLAQIKWHAGRARAS